MISGDDLERYKAEFDKSLDDLLANLPHQKEDFLACKHRCQKASDQYATALLLYADQVNPELAQAYFQQSRRQGESFQGFLNVLTDYQKRHDRNTS